MTSSSGLGLRRNAALSTTSHGRSQNSKRFASSELLDRAAATARRLSNEHGLLFCTLAVCEFAYATRRLRLSVRGGELERRHTGASEFLRALGVHGTSVISGAPGVALGAGFFEAECPPNARTLGRLALNLTTPKETPERMVSDRTLSPRRSLENGAGGS